MTVFEIITLVLSVIAILLSSTTAFLTLLSSFNGRLSISNSITVTRLDVVPSIGIGVYIQNTGAKTGFLDDIRIRVRNSITGSESIFYPQIMRENYNLFQQYETTDWNVFSAILIEPKSSIYKHMIFRPLGDDFRISEGIIKLSVEVRWHDKNEWTRSDLQLTFDITKEVLEHWLNPASTSTYSIFSLETIKIRGIVE